MTKPPPLERVPTQRAPAATNSEEGAGLHLPTLFDGMIVDVLRHGEGMVMMPMAMAMDVVPPAAHNDVLTKCGHGLVGRRSGGTYCRCCGDRAGIGCAGGCSQEDREDDEEARTHTHDDQLTINEYAREQSIGSHVKTTVGSS